MGPHEKFVKQYVALSELSCTSSPSLSGLSAEFRLYMRIADTRKDGAGLGTKEIENKWSIGEVPP